MYCEDIERQRVYRAGEQKHTGASRGGGGGLGDAHKGATL